MSVTPHREKLGAGDERTSHVPIPIIGQVQITDYLITLQLTCPCGRAFLLVGPVGSVRQCPGCLKLYRLASFPTLSATGHIQASIGMARPPSVGGPEA
jgi:hypothetical protein